MEKQPLVIAVSGIKNSGKTTLIEKLIVSLRQCGKEVAVIKHDGHTFSPDTPGTDSFRFWERGAAATAVFDAEKCAVTCRKPVEPEALIAAFSPLADVILLEGFKHSAYPKIELVRAAVSSAPVCDGATVLAYVSDLPLQTDKPIFSFDQTEALTDFLLHLPRNP